MPRASKKIVSQKTVKQLTENLTTLISSLKRDDYISEFIATFLTDEEKIMVSKRLMLYILIEKDWSTQQIVNLLSISRQTVLTHKKKWKKSGNLYHAIMKAMNKRKSTETAWKKLNRMLYPMDLILESRNNIQARAKLYQGDFTELQKK